MIRDLRLARFALAALVAAAFFVSTPALKPAAINAAAAASTGSWTVYHRDDAHTGNDPTLPAANGATAGWSSVALDGHVYAEPLIFNGVVYTATLNDTVYALRQSDGVVLWSKNVGAPQLSGWSCSTLTPGILGTPVIDTATNRIYVAAELASPTTPTYHLFGLDLGNSGNIVLNTPISAAGLDWHTQQQRGALAVRNGYVYVPFGGRAGDCGTYHGWIFAVPTDGTAITHMYSTPGNAAGFWNAGGVVIDDTTGNVFEASGNGTGSGCNANPDGTPTFENDAVVRFSSTLAHQDAFVPLDWQNNWCNNDQDLGSATPVLISPSLMFEAGKWGTGFLLNPASLGGMDGQLYPTPKPASYVEAPVCEGNVSNTADATFGSFAYAAPYIYVGCTGHGVVALSTNTATPSFSPCNAGCGAPDWQAGGAATFGPPIVAGGVVWSIDTGGTGLYGFNANTGATVFHSSAIGVNHFVTPAEAGGQLFVPADNMIMSFNMNFGCTGTPLTTSYINWFDKASPGMIQDNIHILNPGASASSGCVTVTGYPGVAWSAAAGQETHVTLPAGTIGGPVMVTVNSGPAVRASQRVQYNQSFNEVWAESASQAATTSYFNWYDKASPGMLNDNIHLLNPGGTSASVTVSLPGVTPQTVPVAPGAETYVNFPGQIGGPVKVSSTQPVLASQRVQYNQSFNEVWATSGTLATATSYFNWYDKASPGMFNDNIHLLNPGLTGASVTVTLAGVPPQTVTVLAGGEVYVNFPGQIGGPVKVSSTQPVLASQRVQYNSSFNEVWSASVAQATTTSYFNWYDKASPGMFNDNVHLLNPGGTSASVTVTLAGVTPQTVTVPVGGEVYVNFPGQIGGPVTVSSAQPVLASQRVQYYQSFNEIWSG
jgi:hypothetical protein